MENKYILIDLKQYHNFILAALPNFWEILYFLRVIYIPHQVQQMQRTPMKDLNIKRCLN